MAYLFCGALVILSIVLYYLMFTNGGIKWKS